MWRWMMMNTRISNGIGPLALDLDQIREFLHTDRNSKIEHNSINNRFYTNSR